MKNKTHRFLSFISILIVSIFFLSACTPTSTNTSTDTNTESEDNETSENTITIKSMKFSPTTLTVKVGDTVTWKNDDTTHTITADDGEFESGTFSKGKSFSFTFTEAGTYSYHCELHPTMKGTIVVTQ